tara:strand:+ start:206 stop:574 length:369 start_codon:yes stop_codon:yes gene_type:complete
MYTIKVNVDTIDYKIIINYYNNNKSEDEEDLEVLDRFEGGFQIRLRNYNDPNVDENLKVRQLRWDNRCLVTYSLSSMFTEYQLDLLFESLKNCIGECNVEKIDFINNGAFRYVNLKKSLIMT